MKKPILIYNTIVTAILGITGLLTASTSTERLFALLFIPLTFYFIAKSIQAMTPKQSGLKSTSKSLAQTTSKPTSSYQEAEEGEVVRDFKISDNDKRLFLKLIGSSGMGLFLMSIFTKKSHAAFFGSVPGPGTVAIKDTSGNQIDPAEKQPTDGYEISELDETDVTYSYYGFVHKDGAWYIAREDKTTGSYRYAKGASAFSTNWTGKAGLSYGYFDATF